MAVEANISPDDDNSKIRFVRYLYVGKEYPVYHSGTWTNQNHFSLDKIPSVEELAGNLETELFPIAAIKSAMDSGLIGKTETLVFALAACSRQQKSEKLRRAAYNFVAQECKDPQEFMLFVAFASRLSKQSSIPRHGYGHGWRNAVNRWYLSRGASSLAQCVTKYKSRHGWNHRDIITLSHPVMRGISPDIQAVIKYIMFGLEKTKLEFESESRAREVLSLIEETEEFRKCVDPVRAAGLIRTANYTIEHVHMRLIRCPEVWEALIEKMELVTLLDNLQRIHNAGLLTANSQIAEKIITAITNKDHILKSKIHPAVLLIAAKTYEDPERVVMPAKRRAGRKYKLKHQQIPRPDKRIIEALYSALNASFSNVEPTGLRYLMAVSADGWRKKHGNQPVPVPDANKPWVLEAACILALSLLRADEKVTVSTFTAAEGLNARPVHIEKSATFHEAIDRMKMRSGAPPNLGKPILWAAHHRRKYDVFINVVDKMREKYDFTGRAMDLYKKKMNLPNTRLVNWVVGSTSTYMEGKNVNDVLTICGFDVHAPRIIEAFSKHQF